MSVKDSVFSFQQVTAPIQALRQRYNEAVLSDDTSEIANNPIDHICEFISADIFGCGFYYQFHFSDDGTISYVELMYQGQQFMLDLIKRERFSFVPLIGALSCAVSLHNHEFNNPDVGFNTYYFADCCREYMENLLSRDYKTRITFDTDSDEHITHINVIAKNGKNIFKVKHEDWKETGCDA